MVALISLRLPECTWFERSTQSENLFFKLGNYTLTNYTTANKDQNNNETRKKANRNGIRMLSLVNCVRVFMCVCVYAGILSVEHKFKREHYTHFRSLMLIQHVIRIYTIAHRNREIERAQNKYNKHNAKALSHEII